MLRRRVLRKRCTPVHSKRGASQRVATLLQCSRLGGQHDCPRREIRRERVGDRVELLAATLILSLSLGCGLAAARVALEALFSLMTVYSAFHDVSLAPLAMECSHENQPRLDAPAAA